MRFIMALFNRLLNRKSHVSAMLCAIWALQKNIGQELHSAVHRTVPALLMIESYRDEVAGFCVTADPQEHGRTMWMTISCPDAWNCAAMRTVLQNGFPWLLHGSLVVHENTIYCTISSGHGELVDAYMYMRAILGMRNP